MQAVYINLYPTLSLPGAVILQMPNGSPQLNVKQLKKTEIPN